MMNSKESQFDYISELSLGYWKSQALIVGVELGIFSVIYKKELSSSVISRLIKCDKKATELLLNALTGLGFLKKSGSRFKNSVIANRFLVKGQPLYQGNRIQLAKNLWDNWSKLGLAVKSGKPVAFDKAKKQADPKRLDVFISAMHDFATFKSKLMAEKLDLSGCTTLLDLGGGSASYSIELVKANPGLEAVVFDMEDVIKITKRFINRAGVSKRVRTQAGECLSDHYGEDLYDIVLISNILHMYDHDVNMGIIKKCKRALKENGMVVIHDFMLDSSMTKSLFSAIFSLNMLLGTHGGRNYSFKEYMDWLKSAGFRRLNNSQLDANSVLIIGFK